MNTEVFAQQPVPDGSDQPPKYNVPEPFNPADVVCKALLFNNHPDPFRWMVGIDPNALSNDTPTPLKRFLVNRHLRLILGMAKPTVNTNVARFCLIDQGSDNQWEMLINENVAPLIAKHNLPLTGTV